MASLNCKKCGTIHPVCDNFVKRLTWIPIDVRLRLVSAIWDTLPQDADLTPSALQQAELDRRLSEHREDPGSAISHEEIMRRVKSRR